MNRPALLLYCQHSLGLGHLKRSWALAAALARAFRVVLVSGGAAPRELRAPDRVETINLPALAQDADGSLLVVDGTASVEQTRASRIRILQETYDWVDPAVILIELFPFGRRKFAGEIMSIVGRAQASGAVVACSVRDLLVDRGAGQQAHDDRARDVLETYFDCVLVHADPAFARLDETFRPAAPLTIPVHHTGFVVNRADVHDGVAAGGILVSAGGGRFGETLYRAAIEAHQRLGHRALPMTIVAGPLCPSETIERLHTLVRDRAGIRVIDTVDDLSTEMRRAALSISQCGYNTALDILRARVPALVVPFAENGDSEQSDRARRLEQLGAVQVLPADQLQPAGFAGAIERALSFVAAPTALNLDGAEESTRILASMAAAHEHEHVA